MADKNQSQQNPQPGKHGLLHRVFDPSDPLWVLGGMLLGYLGKSGGMGMSNVTEFLQRRSGGASTTTTDASGKTTTTTTDPATEKTKGGTFNLEDERALLALLAIAHQEGSVLGNTLEAQESVIWYGKFMKFLQVKNPQYNNQLRDVLTGMENHPHTIDVNGKIITKLYRYETGDIRRSAINMIAWHAKENVTGANQDDFTATLEWLKTIGVIKKTLTEIGTEKIEHLEIFFSSQDGQKVQQWAEKKSQCVKKQIKTMNIGIIFTLVLIFVLLIVGAQMTPKEKNQTEIQTTTQGVSR
ncbi:MAG: hypothetical protein WCG84_01235 [Candidatus Moraniibacteriota bacterium]